MSAILLSKPAYSATKVLVGEGEHFALPSSLKTLPAYLTWLESESAPEKARADYLNGEVWIDMTYEQVFFHNQVKTEFTIVLGGLAKAERLGRFFADGMLFTNTKANLGAKPDGIFVSSEGLADGRIRFKKGKKEGFVHLMGTPDMVLEVVSVSSVVKDTVFLKKIYWKAGIPEYWLVDVRGERLMFEILRRRDHAYVATRKQEGWVRSSVFNHSFQLTRRKDEQGNPEYGLEVR